MVSREPPAGHLIAEAELVAPETATLSDDGRQQAVVAIDAGAANANKTLNVAAFPAGPPRVVLDANGQWHASTLPASPRWTSANKLFLYESAALDEVLAAWGSFTLTGRRRLDDDTTALTAEVTSSNRFELVAPVRPTVDLGAHSP